MNRRRLIHDDAASGEIRDAWADPVDGLAEANRRAILTDWLAGAAAAFTIGACVIFIAVSARAALLAMGVVQ
ncbi:hypothetical protein ACLB6G_20455 [Zhengella sp. ZM62]|uniref:hypothetical protein n=1 Tax=Zhengella sedimenti TaxID=3390035 RepID=UPI003975514A